MNLITIDAARSHCKADAADDTMLTMYANAAERACARRANRNLYADQTAMDTAIAAIPAKMATAFTNYDAAMATAAAITDERNRLVAEAIAKNALQVAQLDQAFTVGGIVADPDIIGAVLLTTAHFYANREEVVTGQSAAAVQLPDGAAIIMDRVYRIPSHESSCR